MKTFRVKSDSETLVEINGQWVPARPINHRYRSLCERFKDAWAVFTGKADVFTWPGGQ